jgi:hypothetical protein
MQLEDIMLCEVSQVQGDKSSIFSHIYGRQIQKRNIFTKPNMIIYKHTQNMFVIIEILYGALGRRERKRMIGHQQYRNT